MDRKTFGIVYKATNKINNKIYIGQTVRELETRKNEHKRHASKYNYIFYNAIKKYGFDSFEWETIDIAKSIEELNDKEKYWVNYYNSIDISYGYNMKEGGNNSIPNQITRNKMRDSMLGRTFSSETIDKMRYSGKERYKREIINGNKSRIVSKNKFLSYIDSKKREVIDLNTMKIFKSISEASTYYNCYTSVISNCCRDKRTHKGLRFLYYEDYLNNNITPKIDGRANNRKKVICLNTLEIFASTLEVKERMNIDSSCVAKVCNKKRNSAGKHSITGEPLKWAYYEDYLKIHNNDSRASIHNKAS